MQPTTEEMLILARHNAHILPRSDAFLSVAIRGDEWTELAILFRIASEPVPQRINTEGRFAWEDCAMPLLLIPPPPVLSVADLVFAAEKMQWQVEQPLSGLPDLNYRGRADVMLYGEARAVGTWAAALGLSLIGPPGDWVPQLPAQYRAVGKSAICDLEMRVFILEREAVAWCPYARGGERLEYEGICELGAAGQQPGADFATRLLQDEAVAVPPALALDVGRTQGGAWGVVRALPASIAAKFYAPPEPVLAVLRRATRSRTSLRDEDYPWILPPLELTAQNVSSGQ